MTLRQMACISYWLPRLQQSGVQIPATRVITTDIELWRILEPETERAMAGFDGFVDDLRAAARDLGGYPCFLRTGHGSGKHDWLRTCLVPDAASIPKHVAALVEWSECVDIVGLPYKTWAVRQLLPLVAPFTAYNGMPVTRERRYFIERGRVLCYHPYWPVGAVEDGCPMRDAEPVEDWSETLDALNAEPSEEVDHLSALALRVAEHFDGTWSLDFALAADGMWYAIDMAPAPLSFHWEQCPNGRPA